MTMAAHIANLRQRRGTSLTPESTLTMVTDDHSVHFMTEPMLDTWWTSLAPEQKADLYETDLDATFQEPRFIFCDPASPSRDMPGFLQLTEDEFGALLAQAYQIVTRKAQ